MIAGLNSPNIPLTTGALDLSATADVFTFSIPFKCVVLRAGLSIHNDIGATGEVRFDSVQGTTRGDGDCGIIDVVTTHTQGEFVYDDLDTTQIVLEEGDRVVVQVSDAAAAGDLAGAVLIIREIPEVAGNNDKMVLSV